MVDVKDDEAEPVASKQIERQTGRYIHSNNGEQAGKCTRKQEEPKCMYVVQSWILFLEHHLLNAGNH